MRRSEDRILTTHTGSLPRGAELNDLLIADEAGQSVDKAKLKEVEKFMKNPAGWSKAHGGVAQAAE